MKKVTALLIVSAMMLSGCEVSKENSTTATDTETSAVTMKKEEVSFDIRPQDDYYGYVNANDLWSRELEYGHETNGTFDICDNEIMDEQVEMLQEILSSEEEFEAGSPEQLVCDYYLQSKEEKHDYTKEFEKVFSMIDSAETPDDIVEVSAKLLREYGVSVIFNINIERNYYKSGEYLISFNNISAPTELEKLSENPEEFRDSLRNYMSGYGVDYDETVERANAIVYYLLDVANHTNFKALKQLDIDALLNFHTKDELSEMLFNIDVDRLETAYGISRNPYEEYNLCMPEQLEVINSYLTEEHMQMWKDYAKYIFINSYESFAPASYLYYEPTEENVPDDKIMEQVVSVMSTEMSELYYKKYYTDEYKKAMSELESDIKKAYIDMINQADWLSKEGRALFVKKFNNISFYFGGQEEYEHNVSDAKLIGRNLFETNMNFAKRKYQNILDKIGAVPDNSEWSMASQTVNAYYEPSANSIYITRAIMHSPFYDIDGDYYSNMGALGEVIAHELSHAFDSTGVKFNADGIYDPEWISKSDREAYEEIQKKAVAFYNEQTLLDVYHVDGEQTLGENLADLGAIQCVLSLAKTDEDKKKIFESYANIWSSLYENTFVIEALDSDSHSPDLVRANAVLMNMDDFYEVYDVKEGDGMYTAPENRLKRW